MAADHADRCWTPRGERLCGLARHHNAGQQAGRAQPRQARARSAETARRREGWKPVRGETGSARLDAEHESPTPAGTEGGTLISSSIG